MPAALDRIYRIFLGLLLHFFVAKDAKEDLG